MVVRRVLLLLIICLSFSLMAEVASAQSSRQAKKQSKVQKPKKAIKTIIPRSLPSNPYATPVVPVSSFATPEPTPKRPVAPFVAPKASQNTVVAQAPRKARTVSSNYFLTNIGYIWWQETIDLVLPNGGHYSLLANTNGPCMGVGWQHFGARWDFNFNSCAFIAFTDVRIQNPPTANYIYDQTGINTYGIMVGPGLQYRPAGSAVSLGFQVPVIAKYTDWTQPPMNLSTGQSNGEVGPNLRIAGGMLLDGSWRLKRFMIHQKVGYAYNLGYVWQLEIQRMF